MTTTLQPRGYVLYEGPSQFDGSSIVVILGRPGTNAKTGSMWQTWILNASMKPSEAAALGLDASVCGDCPLRPFAVREAKARGEKRVPCYVVLVQAPRAIFDGYQRGIYPRITPEQARKLLAERIVPRKRGRARHRHAPYGIRQSVRLGSYGDPAAVPFEIWERLGVGTGEFSPPGYTHGWLREGFDVRQLDYLMASIDPISADQAEALPENARTYRVIRSGDTLATNEIECPSKRGVQCADCLLCAGSSKRAKNIAILAH